MAGLDFIHIEPQEEQVVEGNFCRLLHRALHTRCEPATPILPFLEVEPGRCCVAAGSRFPPSSKWIQALTGFIIIESHAPDSGVCVSAGSSYRVDAARASACRLLWGSAR